MKDSTYKSAMVALVAIAVLSVGAYVFGPQLGITYQAAPVTGQPGQTQISAAAGYVPFPISVNVPLKDAASPSSAITTASVQGVVYPAGTTAAVAASPTTPFLDSTLIGGGNANGVLNFTSKLTNTGSAYTLKIVDSSQTWYPLLVDMPISALPSTYTGSFTSPNVNLQRIGVFADMIQVNGTKAGGIAFGTISTSNTTESTASNTLTINLSEAAGDPSFIIPINIGNTNVNSYLNSVVLVPQTALTGTTIPTSAFTSASLQYSTGTNFNLPSNIISYITAQQAIPVGIVDSSKSGTVNLVFTLSKSSLVSGETFSFILDDQGSYLGVDNIQGGRGATAQTFTVAVIA